MAYMVLVIPSLIRVSTIFLCRWKSIDLDQVLLFVNLLTNIDVIRYSQVENTTVS